MDEVSSIEYRVRFVGSTNYAVCLPRTSTAKELKERCRFLEISSPSIVVCLPEFRIDPEIQITESDFNQLIWFLSDLGIETCNRISAYRDGLTFIVQLSLYLQDNCLNDCVSKNTIPLELSEEKAKELLFDFETLTQLLVEN